MTEAASTEQAQAVLQHFELAGASVRRLGSGLINDTFAVQATDSAWVLQRVHTVFSPQIHHNIVAVTEHLRAAGVTTPLLRRTQDGQPWYEDEHGRAWRVMTRLPGVTFDAVRSAAQAHAAAATLARFHGALSDLDHAFVGLRTGVHDTPKHLDNLRAAVQTHREHRLYDEVAPLADAILAAAEALPSLTSIPARVVHGDPKLNNVVFAGLYGDDVHRAVGLIDLDTVAPMALHLELGDAWRSWCNPKGEDEAAAQFDFGVFEASVRGYASAGVVSPEERGALVHGVELISVELASRFLADALAESYFGWNADKYASRGEHNLVRARGQWSLHQAALEGRHARETLLRAVFCG